MKLGKLTGTFAAAAVAAIVELLSGGSASAVTLTGLDFDNNLVFFDSATPGTINKVGITGIQSGETLFGIDYRPATNQLYGLGSSNQLYLIDKVTGVATSVGTPTSLVGSAFGVDFNPTVDRFRVVSNAEQNLRLNQINGTLAGTDTPLAYAPGDVNAGKNPTIVGSAYTNNFAGATSTTLYSIDSVRDVLVTQGGLNSVPSPNGGLLFTVGSLGVDFDSELVGFDILSFNGVDTAFATSSSRLYTIDLGTGAATLLGTIGGGVPLRGVAAEAVPEPTTMAGLALAGGGLTLLKRRQKRQEADEK